MLDEINALQKKFPGIEFEEFLNMVAPSHHHTKVTDHQKLSARSMWMSMDPSAHLTEDEKQAYKQVFDEFDRDGGGSIDVTELREAFWALGGEPSLSEVAAIMKEIDTDGNGTLDFNEFLQITHPKVVDDFKDLEETFVQWDKDKDGYLSSVELLDYFNSFSISSSTSSGGMDSKSAAPSRRNSNNLGGDLKLQLNSRRNSINSLATPSTTPGSTPIKSRGLSSRRSTAFVGMSDTMILVKEIIDSCEDVRGLSFDSFVQMLTT